MFIHEVCRECKLTKKAIEYYTEQSLISPVIGENGYRDFSVSDIERLKKIAILRGLGLSVSDIRMLINSLDKGELIKISHKKELEISELQEKQQLIKKLAQDNDWDSAHQALELLERKNSIAQRLLCRFPGHYGKYLSVHFSSFLNEPITTCEQQKAFETISNYLDGVDITIPDDLKDYLDEAAKDISGAIPDITKNVNDAIRNPEQYLADNKETIEEYMEYMKSDLYKQSSAFRMKECLLQFNNQSGYYDVFIPAMKELSYAYRQYHNDMIKANEVFERQYGDLNS